MEAKGAITCAGCRWNKQKLIKCCRTITESFCNIGNDNSHKKGYCNDRESRFESMKIVKKSMEVELL